MVMDRTDEGTTDGTASDRKELLAPFDGSRGAEEVLRRACRMARRDGDWLTVLCMVNPPHDDETDWGDPTLDPGAMSALARAQTICREEGVVGAFTLTSARDLAAAIVAEARRSDAALIWMSLDEYDQHGPGERGPMSDIVKSVVATAPCSVLLGAPATEVVSATSERTSRGRPVGGG